MVSGSCLKARGLRLMAHGQEKIGARARAWGTQRQIFLGHEPWATSLQAWALSHEPLIIHNRLINEWYQVWSKNSDFHPCISHPQGWNRQAF